LVNAGTVFAVPYQWTAGQIQDLIDVTSGFHGGAGQLSTIDSISLIPDGIELDVTFRIGQEADPFAPNYGLAFARVSLAAPLGFPGLDLSAFTSSFVHVTTSTDIVVQSFLQTDFMEDGASIDDGDGIPGESFSFLFWEHNDAVAAGAAIADFDFSSGTEFSGEWNLLNPQAVQGTDAIRQWGLQLGKFSGVSIDTPVSATILIRGAQAVPEPSTLTLVGLTLLGALGFLRPRK
jgi:hypothetical protein